MDRYKGTTPNELHINQLLFRVLQIKEETCDDALVYAFADDLEKMLLKIKNGEKDLEL